VDTTAAREAAHNPLQGRRAVGLACLTALASLSLLAAGQVQPLGQGTALAGMALAGSLVCFSIAFSGNMRAVAGSRHEALTDALTGLRNRRSLREDLEDALSRATPDRPALLVLLDLDGFKHYNDSFGHPAGDALLARLGAGLNRTVKAKGRAYRLGGDEFCVLYEAPGRDPHHMTAEAASALCQSGRGFSITASHGMAVLPTEAHTPEHALQLADQRLYDTIYQERYMGVPEQNQAGYLAGSPIHFAEGLKGRLLVVHGTGDDNVHYQGTERLIDRMIGLGKAFDLMVYPNRSHSISEGSGTTLHVYRLVARYLLQHMPPDRTLK